MQKESKILDDLAKVANGAMSSFATLRDEAEERLRQQFERVLARMDMVRRDEFEAVRAMAVKAREENEALQKRIAALEAARKPAATKATQSTRTRKSPASPRPRAKKPTKTAGKTTAK